MAFTKKSLALALLASAFFFCSPVKSTVSASEPKSSINPVPWTYLLLRTEGIPQPFRGSEGKINVCYDLAIQNFSQNPSTISKLEVIDADTKKVLKSYDAELLKKWMLVAGAPRGPELPAGGSAVLMVDLEFDKSADVPQTLSHHVVFDSKSPIPELSHWDYTVEPVKVDKRPPIVIGSPFVGGTWLAGGGYAAMASHRRAIFPVDNKLQSSQRYAIDWEHLDKNRYGIVGDSSKNENNVTWGQPILAVGDGTVIGVIDRFPDQPPFNPGGSNRYFYPSGNTIVLQLGNHQFAMYAHLKPHSIKVHEGQHVKRGELIAEAGNSGNSTGSHLHLHIMDGPNPIASNGIPYVFDNFKVVGEITDENLYELEDKESKQHTVATSPFAGEHRDELARDGALVEFPSIAPAK